MGRSLITVAGVALGIAFLMSTLTGRLIVRAVAQEQELRRQTSLMLTLVRTEVGDVPGRTLAVAAFGRLTEVERRLLDRLAAQKPAALRGFGCEGVGISRAELPALGEGADLLLVLGDAPQTTLAMSELTRGMRQRVALDSLAERRFADGAGDPTVRRELFFGAQQTRNASDQQAKAAQERARMIWIVVVALLVTAIGISNALLMSVTERFREIGTMKCLGALSSFIRTLYLIESALIGVTGSLAGAVLGALLPIVAYGLVYGFAWVLGPLSYVGLGLAMLGSVATGTILAVLAALYPAGYASRMVPASALRSSV
jgi:ABC-type antimicrobial peptide transport system permease subunit